jgi:MoaA/NifB/PqqE/SkfB family radical SAM enzyme
MDILKKELVEKMDLDLTGKCSLSCPMCAFNYLDDEHITAEQKPLEEMIAFLDQFPKLDVLWIAGAYSEPLMYNDMFGLVDYLHSRNISVNISTHGSIHTEAWWRKFSKALNSNDIITFTIDGYTQEMHEKYRAGAILDKVVRNAKAFIDPIKKHDNALTVRFVYNDKHMDEISKFIKDIGFSNHEIVECKPHIINNIHPNMYKNEFDIDLISPIASIQKKYDVVQGRGIDIINDKSNMTLECDSKVMNHIYVSNLLEILPCCEIARNSPKAKHWDLDYDSINDFSHDCCYVCEKGLKTITGSILDRGNYLI